MNIENYIIHIEKILKETGWSQERLAQKIGVTFASLNRWINGHTTPHPTHAQLIDKLFKDIVGIEPVPTKEIKAVLRQVMDQKKRYGHIRKYLKDQEITDAFLLELTYNSNAIEGSTLNKKQTEAIIFDKATIDDKTLIEHLEAVNHTSILKDVLKGKIAGKITENLILDIHKQLMQGIREDGGQYAKHQRGIRGMDLALPHPDDIYEEMKGFLKAVNHFQGHTIAHVAQMHAVFEAIHPFGDGNGRVGRILMIIQLMSRGFTPCIISIDDRALYYEVLEYAHKQSSSHLTQFIVQSVLKGYEILSRHQKS